MPYLQLFNLIHVRSPFHLNFIQQLLITLLKVIEFLLQLWNLQKDIENQPFIYVMTLSAINVFFFWNPKQQINLKLSVNGL